MAPIVSKQMLKVLAISVAILPVISMAAEYEVGDDDGWDLGVNYTAWAENNEFTVGDRLVFMYARGDHNVVVLGGPDDFQTCNVPKGSQVLESGRDVVTLLTAGTKWYICGKNNHCDAGQKLAITVLPAITVRDAPPPGPASSSSTASMTSTTFQILATGASVVLMIVSI